LGEFSLLPVWLLLNFGSFMKITEVAQNSVLLFPHSYALILTKNGFGYYLGHIFKNSSGHPDYSYSGVWLCG
jgi:hypothetical protein